MKVDDNQLILRKAATKVRLSIAMKLIIDCQFFLSHIVTTKGELSPNI